MNIPKTILDLEALLFALERQTDPLPESLQRSLKMTGKALQEDRPEAARQLRQLIASYPPLENAYRKAIEDLDLAESDRERAKSLNAVFPDTLDFETIFIREILPSSDWVNTVKQLPREFAKENTSATPSQFWDKADRLMIVTVGGAALGGSIAGIPGALIGAVFAGGYGWYITFRKTTRREAIELDSNQTEILQALDKYRLSIEYLAHTIGRPLSETRIIVEDLWRKGYIDSLKSPTIYILFPELRSQKSHQYPPDDNDFLTLTRRGYFSLYPLVQRSREEGMT